MSHNLRPLLTVAAIVAAYVFSRLLDLGVGAGVMFAALLGVLMVRESDRRRSAVAKMQALKRSIVDHRQVVKDLGEANRLLLMTEKTAHVGHWEVDLETERLFWSDETCRIHGLPSGSAPDLETAVGVYHPDDQGMILEYIDRAVATGQGYRFEARLIRPDGEIRHVEAIAKVQCDENGAARTMFGTFRDRTEELEREEKLRRALVDARHAALAKTRFLANMSHEIRTPMNGLIGFTDLLLSEPLEPRQRRFAELIGDSGRSMLALLNDILDISKIEAGSLELAEEEVDVRAKIANCADIMRAGAMGKGIEIETHVDDDVPRALLGDQLRFRQILLNLIGNAVKFTEEGGVRVHARRCDATAGDGEQLIVDIADTGVGIAPDKLDAIFDNFRQADATTARRFGGTGLGLAISRNLARLMNGDIRVSSVPGEGSTFSLRLPLRAIDTPTIETPADVEPSIRLEGPARVLIVEDNEINQVLSEAMCDELGLEHDLAANGAEAVAQVGKAASDGRPYDLVLMDLQMPLVDGFEAARRLRAAGHDADRLPIVALTANAYAEDIEACRSAGMQDHLTKPVTLKRVREMVARYVKLPSEQGKRSEDIPETLRATG